MKILRESNENEMILEFLKGEISSKRFNEQLSIILEELNVDEKIINKGDINSKEENESRLEIMRLYRGYPDKELFNNFPKDITWKYAELSEEDINHVYYINYDYWNELSNNTSNPMEAAKVILSGKEIYDVSNKPFLDGVKYINSNKFPPVILLTCNGDKLLIIEGHSRMTVYGFDPSKLNGTYAYIGYCKKEDMKKYDSRMI